MIGALCHYVAHADAKDFQPMKANFGLVPELERPIRHKQARHAAYAARAFEALEAISRSHYLPSTQPIQRDTKK